MKLICLTISFFAAIGTTLVEAQPAAPKHHNHVSVLSVKNEVFYFKVDADFIGATVEVYDSTGMVFFTAELHTKRNLIDFFNLENGTYTVHFESHGIIEEYQVWLDDKNKMAINHLNTFKLKV